MEVVARKGARRCRCRARDAHTKLLEAAHNPRRFAKCSFSNYHPTSDYGSQLHAFNYTDRLVHDYPATDRGLLLACPCGVGKTHLAVAIIRGLVEKGVPCLFYEFGSLLKDLQGAFDRAGELTEARLLAPIYEAKVLVHDGLGVSNPTDWVRDTMTQIVGRHYNDRKLTIFTTNYMDERAGPSGETLADRVGARLRSRLYEMCQTVIVDGPDYRAGLDDENF